MKGILFTPDNIRATAEKRKTETRRLDHLKEINKEPNCYSVAQGVIAADGSHKFWHKTFAGNYDGNNKWVKPRYKVGEIVYIKEEHYLFGVWAYEGTPDDFIPLNKRKWRFVRESNEIKFLDNRPDFARHNWRDGRGWYKRSPLFLEAKDARYFIKITSILPQRLQDIREEDAKAEGMAELFVVPNPQLLYPDVLGYRRGFLFIWNSINKAYPWELNPWDWVYSYELLDRSN